MPAVVIGNITLDETFALAALPQPGETVLARTLSTDLGGKGANQAVMLARAGIATRLVAVIGQDAAADWLTERLRTEAVDAQLRSDAARPTDRSIILLADGGENSIVSTAACARALSAAEAEQAVAMAGPGDLLLLQGNLDADVTLAALRAGRRRGMRTVFNPSPVQPHFATFWPLVDLVVANRGEALQLTGSEAPAAAARAMHAAGAARAVVTLGADGAVLCEAGGLHAAQAAPAAVRDTTGAGDSFTAVLAAALFARGLETPQALAAASAAAALTVGRAGTLAAFPTAVELRTILR